MTPIEIEPMTASPHPATTDLRSVPFPEAFREGAQNAVTTCLRIQPEERVTLIADEETLSIAGLSWTGSAARGTGLCWRSLRRDRWQRCQGRCWRTWKRRR